MSQLRWPMEFPMEVLITCDPQESVLTLSGAGGPGDMVMTEKKHVANSFLDFDLG